MNSYFLKRSVLASALTGLLLTSHLVLAATAFQSEQGRQYANAEIIVKYKANLSNSQRIQTAASYGAKAEENQNEHSDWWLHRLPPNVSVAQALKLYANDPNIASVQPNYVYQSTALPGPLPDPAYNQQWGIHNIGQTISTGTSTTQGIAGADMRLEAAWNIQTDCSSVTIAVVDTGINYNASDLAANMWNGGATAPLHGWDFVGTGSNDPMDYNGHGTHVAGILGAVGGNGIGVTGVCWKASIMAVRVLDASGSGTTSTVVQGIDYAITHGAKIINLSLGGSGPFDPVFNDALNRAQAANVLVVVAAGNAASNNEVAPVWPCNFTHPNLVCVTALDQNYNLASYSNWGATSVDIAAPGSYIYSTSNGIEGQINDALTPAVGGWLGSTNHAAGWGYGLNGPGLTSSAPWAGVPYSASGDDRIYKTFNLSGVSVARLTLTAAVSVNAGDYFNANIRAAGGDPFVGGTPIFSSTNLNTGLVSVKSIAYDLTPNIGPACSIGFQLLSAANTTGNYGVAMTALRIDTLTLDNNSYKTMSGTSMATPYAAGVAALVWAHNPRFTYTHVKNALTKGGRPLSVLTGLTNSGMAVDALGALTYIQPSKNLTAVVH
jgi:subtilisin family serine protease